MTRNQYVTKLAERTGLSKADINLIVSQEENLIYEIIAKCDSIQFIWGKIGGEEKTPFKVSGKFAVVSGILKNHGWSNWKIGYPFLKWSCAAKTCDNKTPEEYFSTPEHRYTTLARQYRKDAKLPEIPEYIDLPEEKIVELCHKADEVEQKHLTQGKLHNKLYRRKGNEDSFKARRLLWQQTGYKPIGAIAIPDTGLDPNSKAGELYPNQRDRIDYWLAAVNSTRKEYTWSWKYLLVQHIKRIANEIDNHLHDQEIKEAEDLILSKLKAQNEDPPVYTEELYRHFEHLDIIKARYNKEEDPWDIQRSKYQAERLAEQKELSTEFREDVHDLSNLEEFEVTKD